MASLEDEKMNEDEIIKIALLKLLKVDDKGWNIALFKNKYKMAACLCNYCKSVCNDVMMQLN